MKHLSDEQVKKFRDRSLSSQEFFIVDDHLAECDQCREQLAGANDLWRLNKAFRQEVDHLDFDQMAAFVDGSLNDSERTSIEEHLQQCPICQREVDDLKKFRNSMSESVESKTIPFKQKSSAGLFKSVASIAALLAIASITAVFWYQNRVKELEVQLKQAQVQNDHLQREIQQNSQTNQPQSKEALILQDGQSQIRIEKDGGIIANLVIPENEQKRIREVIENQKFDVPPNVSKLIGRKEILMGDDEKLPFSLIRPVGTAVSIERPIFGWETLPDAQEYQVRVYDEEFREILRSPWIRESQWTSTQGLPSGVTLTWQVAAKKRGEEIISPYAPFPDAKFLILTLPDIQKAIAIRNMYAGSHLILGIHFAQLGLLDDAEKEFVALQKVNPKSAEVSTLLNTLKNYRSPN